MCVCAYTYIYIHTCTVCLHNDQHQETVYLVSAAISVNMIRIVCRAELIPAGSMPAVIVS